MRRHIPAIDPLVNGVAFNAEVHGEFVHRQPALIEKRCGWAIRGARVQFIRIQQFSSELGRTASHAFLGWEWLNYRGIILTADSIECAPLFIQQRSVLGERRSRCITQGPFFGDPSNSARCRSDNAHLDRSSTCRGFLIDRCVAQLVRSTPTTMPHCSNSEVLHSHELNCRRPHAFGPTMVVQSSLFLPFRIFAIASSTRCTNSEPGTFRTTARRMMAVNDGLLRPRSKMLTYFG